MKNVKSLLDSLYETLIRITRNNAVIAKPISVGDQHVVPVCDLMIGIGSGVGYGEGEGEGGGHHLSGKGKGKGLGAAGGGGTRIIPQAIIIIEDNQVRIESLS